MGAVHFLVTLLIAGLVGYLASALMGTQRIHVLMLVVLGFIGAAVGRWVSGYFGWPEPLPVYIAGANFPLVWSVAGSAFVIAVVNMIRSH